MPNYSYHCPECNTELTEQFPMNARPDRIICSTCQGQAEYRISSPTVFRASFLDGTKRFQNLKEAAKINKEAVVSRSQETRKQIAAEIKRMGVRLNKD